MDAESKYWAIDLTSNYAFKPIAEQALRSNQTVVPQRLNAALDVRSSGRSRESTEVEGKDLLGHLS